MRLGREHCIGASMLRHHFLCVYSHTEQTALHVVCLQTAQRLADYPRRRISVRINSNVSCEAPAEAHGWAQAREGVSRNRAAINGVSESPSTKLDQDTAAADEDKKEITAGTHCSTTHKSLLGHSPLAVTTFTLLEYM